MSIEKKFAEEIFTKKLGWDETKAHGAIIRLKSTETIFITKLEQAWKYKDYISPVVMQVIIQIFQNKGLFVKIEEDRWIKPLIPGNDFELWSAMSESPRKTYAVLQLM